MGEYAVEKREITPKNFFAGDFPTVPETGTANAAIISVGSINRAKQTRIRRFYRC